MVKTINNYNYEYVDAWSNPDEVNPLTKDMLKCINS